MKINTVIDTGTPPPFEACIAETVFLAPVPEAGWPEVFAIVTAHNPVVGDGEEAPSEEENHRRAALLRRQLAEDGHATFPVTGASPDRTHQEAGEGFATEDLGYAARLARDYGQWGFFWVQQGRVFICIDESGQGWYIGAWAEKLMMPTM